MSEYQISAATPPPGPRPPAGSMLRMLSISPHDEDHESLERIVCGSPSAEDGCPEWELNRAFTPRAAFRALEQSKIAVVVCECDLVSGTWRDMLEYVSRLADPPLLIVSSRLADEHLWAEALNRGAFDVIAKPFNTAELIRVLACARQHWMDRYGLHAKRTEQRKAAMG